jgi:hypothetical protein
MKKFKRTNILFVAIGLFVLGIIGYSILKNIGYPYTIKIKEKAGCSGERELYYTDKSNRKYYLSCLDSIVLNFNDKQISLKEALESNKVSVGGIISHLASEGGYWDGGSTTYRDDGTTGFSDNGFSILKCNTVDGNRDYYIGNKDMTKGTDFCN